MEPSTEEKYCKICFELSPKYVCPQCGIDYCSTKCFSNTEKHLQCSENFYKRCVQETLGTNSKQSAENVKSMKEILERFHSQQDEGQKDLLHLGDDDNKGDGNSSESEGNEGEEEEEEDSELDSDDDEPLDQRLGDVDLDDSETVWSRLTEEEKEEFKKLVRESQLKGIEPVPEPWHPEKVSKKRIHEVDEK